MIETRLAMDRGLLYRGPAIPADASAVGLVVADASVVYRIPRGDAALLPSLTADLGQVVGPERLMTRILEVLVDRGPDSYLTISSYPGDGGNWLSAVGWCVEASTAMTAGSGASRIGVTASVRLTLEPPFLERLKVSSLSETAFGVARKILDTGVYGNLPVLADALQDAGFDDQEVLDVCRAANGWAGAILVSDLVSLADTNYFARVSGSGVR